MNEQFDLVRELFWEALDVAEPEQRRLFLEQRCQNEPALLAELQKMLDAHEQSGGFLEEGERDTSESAEQQALDPDQVENLTGHRIRGYLIREQLGEGGMGTVYVAEQSQPVQRKVALKVIRPGMATSDVLGRFQAERQALAMMAHPNIASIHDAGTTPQGLPFFAMELVRGAPITEYADEYRLSTEARLRLFQSVCNAVQHAHLKGIIHRDLKPNNVLVTRIDGEDVVKVIDFGVAKATSQRLTEKSIYTRHTQVIGTPMYMSPEQAQFSGTDVDTRSDVYSLGVLLYRLLSGRSPFESSRFAEADLDEVRRIIREETPPLPSEQVSRLEAEARTTLSNQHRSAPERMVHALRGELDWIVMKAMDKDRDRRYESASALAADIECYLCGDPVLACPPSKWYLFGKFARKNAAVLGTSALVLAMMVIAVGVSLSYADSAEKAEALANSRLEQSERDLERTLDAMNTIVGELTSAENAVDPAIVAVREASLKRVLEVYRQIALEHSEDEDVQVQTAMAHFRICEILASDGLHDEAIKESTIAIDMMSALYNKHPSRVECGDKLVEMLDHRMRQHSDLDECVADGNRARVVAKELLDRSPTPERLASFMNLSVYMTERLEYLSERIQKTPTLRGAILAEATEVAERNSVYSSPEVCAMVARVAVEQRDWATAEANFRKYFSLEEKLAGPDSRDWLIKKASYCSEFALVLDRLDNQDGALQYHLQAIEICRSLYAEYPHLARHKEDLQVQLETFFEYATGETQLAEASRQLLLDRSVLDFKLHDVYGACLARQDSPGERLTEAIATFPDEPVYLAYRSEIYERQGDTRQANEDLELAKQLFAALDGTVNEGEKATWTDRFAAHHALAEVAEMLGLYEQSLNHYDIAIAMKPESHAFYKHRAVIHWRLGMEEAMLKDLRIAITRFRDPAALPWGPLDEFAGAKPETKREMLRLANELIELTDHCGDAYVVRGILNYCFGNRAQSLADLIHAARRPIGRDPGVAIWLMYDNDLVDAVGTQSNDPAFIQAVEVLMERERVYRAAKGEPPSALRLSYLAPRRAESAAKDSNE